MELTQPHLAPPCHAAPGNTIISQLIGILAFGKDTLPSETFDYGENLLNRLQQPSLPDTERENIAREARGFVGALENAGRDRNKGERLGQYADETARAIGEPADDLDGILDRRLEMVGKLGKRLENQAAREQYIENTRRAQAREFWRARKEVGAGETETAPETMQQVISECTDVINWLLTLANCPAEHRPFLDAAIGLYHQQLSTMIDSAETSPDEQGWFAADDFSIGSRIQGTRAGNVSVAAVKKTAQRARTAFFAWQESNGYGFVDFQPGGVRLGIKYKSLYRLPILEAAAGALIEARKRPTWELNPTKAIRDEAREWLAWRLQRQPVVIERFYRPRQDAEAQTTRRHRMSFSGLRANLEQINLTGSSLIFYMQSVLLEIATLFTWIRPGWRSELSTFIQENYGQPLSPPKSEEEEIKRAAYEYARSRRTGHGVRLAQDRLLAMADALIPPGVPTEPDPLGDGAEFSCGSIGPPHELTELSAEPGEEHRLPLPETPNPSGQNCPQEPPTDREAAPEWAEETAAEKQPGPYGQICPQGPQTESETDMTKKTRRGPSRSLFRAKPKSEAPAAQRQLRSAVNDIRADMEQVRRTGGDPQAYAGSVLLEVAAMFRPLMPPSPPAPMAAFLVAADEYADALCSGCGINEAFDRLLAATKAAGLPNPPTDSDPPDEQTG